MREWTLDEATAALPMVRQRLARIRELVARAREQQAALGGNGVRPSDNGHGGAHADERELRAHLEALDEAGIIVRDPGRGLVDFPTRSPSGQPYLLCWLDGEEAIEWWHWPDAGFAGRTPLSEAPE